MLSQKLHQAADRADDGEVWPNVMPPHAHAWECCKEMADVLQIHSAVLCTVVRTGHVQRQSTHVSQWLRSMTVLTITLTWASTADRAGDGVAGGDEPR